MCSNDRSLVRHDYLNSPCPLFVAMIVFLVSPNLCEEIADMRRKIQRVSKKRVVFLDEVSVKLNEGENYTLVLPGEKQYTTVTDTSTYAPRYDMIAACNGERVLPPIIFTPLDRVNENVRGITKRMLEQAVDSVTECASPSRRRAG
jgi:hypothetical protein